MDTVDLKIVVGGTSPVKNEASEVKKHSRNAIKGVRRDRRKNRRDRRRSVREGIFVTLSADNNRRFLRDRRKASL